jgi:hypothetical protein
LSKHLFFSAMKGVEPKERMDTPKDTPKEEIYFLEFMAYVNSKPATKKRLREIYTKTELETFYMDWLRNISGLPLVRGCSLGSLIFRFRVHKMLFVRDEHLYWASNGKVNLGTPEKPVWKAIFSPQSNSNSEQEMRKNRITWDCKETLTFLPQTNLYV